MIEWVSKLCNIDLESGVILKILEELFFCIKEKEKGQSTRTIDIGLLDVGIIYIEY